MTHKFISLFFALAITFAGVGPALAADGDLDPTFGSGGKVTTDFGSEFDSGFAVALQRDGKIVVAGQTFNGSNTDFALARTIADLARCEEIQSVHLAEALQYRPKPIMG